jgi:hypothetical protein
MGTHVIFDARTRKVRASLDAPGEGTTIFVVDLIGDTWDDFGYFLEQAARFESSRELRLRNRYVRAAIADLFSHLDGVVGDLFRTLENEAAFKPYLPRRREFSSLKAKMAALASFLASERGLTLPPVDLNMKLLRDIVNHPSITKEGAGACSTDTLLYDGADVYGIGIEDLRATGSAIDLWLNAVCPAAAYERFRDTMRLSEDLARELLGTPGSAHQF